MTTAALQSFATAFTTAAANPVPLLVVVGVVGAGIWKLASTHFNSRIAILDDRLKLKDDQIAAVARERLKEADKNLPKAHPTGDVAVSTDATVAVTSHAADLKSAEATTFVEGDRVFIKNYTYAGLMDIFEGKTSLQQESIAAPFLGKWLKVDLIVSNIFRNGKTITVLATYPEEAARYIWLHFTEMLGAIEILNIGDRLSAVGEIREVDFLTIRLFECELI